MATVAAPKVATNGTTRVACSRSSFARESLYFWAALGLCPIIAFIEPGDVTSVSANANQLLEIETSLGIDNEARLAGWFRDQQLLHGLIQAYYYVAHIPFVVGTLVWLWHRRPALYIRARNAFLLTQVVVAAGYLALPTAPPHLLDQLGAGVATETSAANWLQYEFAAFPSGHVAFAFVAALPLIGALRKTVQRVLVALHPLITVIGVIVTDNHYWLDVFAGAAIAMCCYLFVLKLQSFEDDSMRTNSSR